MNKFEYIKNISPIDLSYLASMLDLFGRFNIQALRSGRHFDTHLRMPLNFDEVAIRDFLVEKVGGRFHSSANNNRAKTRLKEGVYSATTAKRYLWYISGDELLNLSLQILPYLKSVHKYNRCESVIKMRMTYWGQPNMSNSGLRPEILDERRKIFNEFKQVQKAWIEKVVLE